MITSPPSRKVVLVYSDKGSVVYPQGLLYLAAHLLQRGYAPRILDTRVETPEPAIFEDALAIGISSMTGNQITESLAVAAMARKAAPRAPIIWGGLHATLLPEQTLAHPLVDVVVRQEGELALCDVLDRIVAGSNDFSGIPFMHWTDGDGRVMQTPDGHPINLDSTPTLPYHLLRLDRYPKSTEYFPYMATRGCPWRCTFCYTGGVNASVRKRSAGMVLDDFERIGREIGLKRNLHFLDDNLLTSKVYARELFTAKMSRGFDFEWNGSTTIRGFLRYSDEEMALLKRSGLTFLRFGAESGSQEIIDKIRKKFTPDDAIELIDRCKRADIGVVFNFMAGFPGETEKDLRLTFDLIDRLRARYDKFIVKTIWRLLPFPGTELYDEAVRQGFPAPTSLEDWGGYGFTAMPRLPWLSPSRFERLEVINNITRYPFLEKPKWSWRAFRRQPFETFLKWSAQVRWRLRFFALPIEWKIRSRRIQLVAGKGAI